MMDPSKSRNGLRGAFILALSLLISASPAHANDPSDDTTPAVTLAVTPSLVVSAGSLPDAPVNLPFSATLSAQGGTPPYAWAFAGGTPPPGLTLRPSGTLTGTPSKAGSFIFSIRATDQTGVSAVGTFSLNVIPAPLTIVAPSPLAAGMVTVDYAAQHLAATGGVPPYTFAVTAGALPAGLMLVTDGTLFGTPSSAGLSTFAVTVTDSTGPPAARPATSARTATIQMNIRPFTPDVVLSAGSLSFAVAAGTVGLPGNQVVEVQSSDVNQVLSWTVAVSPPGAPWLAVTPAGGGTPGAFTVSLTGAASALSPSATPYSATITVTCSAPSPCAGTTETVPVSLVVASVPPQLSAISDTLLFTASSTAPQAVTQSLLLSNTGGGSIGIGSISCGASWCRVGAPPGTILAGQISLTDITADPSNLTAGYYSTTITIIGSTGTTVIPVTFLITPYETISLAPSAVHVDLQPPGEVLNGGAFSFLVAVHGNQAVNWAAALLPGAPWLKLNTASGTSTAAQPGQVNFTIDTAAASAGGVKLYYATIRVSADGVADSPLDFQVVLNVVGPNARPRPLPTPVGLLFTATAGSASPPPQTVFLPTSAAGVLSFQASTATSDGGNWLSVSPQTGAFSSTDTGRTSVAVKTDGLAPGIYLGTVAYAYHFFGIRTVTVTLVLQPATAPHPSALPQSAAQACSPTKLVPVQTGLVTNFSSPAAWPTPLFVQLFDDCADAVVNGQVTVTFSNGDPPLTMALTDATDGVYSATWTPRHTDSQLTLSARITAPGFPAVSAALMGEVTPNAVPAVNHNAAINVFNPQAGAPMAPGTLAAIFGANLANQTAISSTLPLPDSLQGTSVIIGGRQAPILFVSPGQVNVQVPFELASGQPYQVIVSTPGGLTSPEVIHLAGVSPGVAESPGGQVIAQHIDSKGTLVSESAPAQPGEFIVLYLVGLGLTDTPVASGIASPSSPPANAADMPSITINGEDVKILFAGLTPGLVGLYQMDVQVPLDAKDGDLNLLIAQAGAAANTGILPVRSVATVPSSARIDQQTAAGYIRSGLHIRSFERSPRPGNIYDALRE
jgi:uncharacterized protein (TIGR03437 family)